MMQMILGGFLTVSDGNVVLFKFTANNGLEAVSGYGATFVGRQWIQWMQQGGWRVLKHRPGARQPLCFPNFH
jgi:hypothetical protein